MAIFQLWSQFSQKGAPLWEWKYFPPTFPPKRSLGIEDLQKIKFHNFTLDSDLGIRCVNVATQVVDDCILRGLSLIAYFGDCDLGDLGGIV